MTSSSSPSGLSLRAQLYSLVIAIVLFSFVGSSWVSVTTTQGYLNEQMETHSQDAATRLGLSIAPFIGGEDMVMVETMIAAIFDSGYYEALMLTDRHGKVLLSRHNEVLVDGVPQWFIEAFTLTPPTMKTEINDDSRIAGVLSIKSHSGISYHKLWQHAVNNLYLSLVICIIALLLAYLILRAVLNPLAKVEEQALAVSRKQFPLINNLPMTPELKTVVKAMNLMVTNIQTTFDQMSKHAEKLTRDAFVDSLTNLGNRRALESQFRADSAEMESSDSATFGMIQLPSLQSINTYLGFKEGDDYVCRAAYMINEVFKTFVNMKLYRVGGGSFFFTIKETGTDVLAMCESIHEKFNALNSAYYPDGFAEVIATTYTKKDKVGSLLAKLDTLLTQESSSTKEGLVYCDHDSKNSHGLHQWSDLIDQIVKSNNVKFMFQPIKSCSDDNVLYYELFTQFFIDKQSIANNQLYAMAERLNKSILLDKMVLSQLLSLGYFAPDTKLAINLTQQSLHDINFRNWLANFFVGNRGKLPELVFEINEDAVLTSVDSSTDFIKMCKRFDIEICIERFGSSFTSFKYLKGLDIDFLKIDGAYIRDLDQNPENNHFIQAVTQIGHGVGIKVLASHVENEASLKLLKELNCNGAQGNYIQRTMYLIEKEPQSECVYSPIKLVPS